MNEEIFSGKADVYDRYRPSYPKELIDWLYEKTHAASVADIGAGTGKFTACLVEKPWDITAVEPNGDMLEKLRKNLPHIRIVNAPAEDTGLAAGSVDLVTAATAFHWFDKEKFKAECLRIFTPGGRLALVWNNHGKNDFSCERDRIFLKYCGTCNSITGGEEEGDRFLRNEYFSEMEFFAAPNNVPMDEEGFVGYSLSHSYSLKEGDEGYGEFAAELHTAFKKYEKDGIAEMPFRTTCYLGRFA